MRKLLIFILILGSIVALTQATAEESDYYVKTVQVTTVFPHSEGYRVIYLKDNMDFADLHIPLDWTKTEPPKAEFVFDTDPAFPYISIFYKNGEFSHVRLYMRKSINHSSYGTPNPAIDRSEQFDIETLEIEY
ncbi:MAG: hypothetical protein K9L29_08980 [Spirochaetales bacterium]|nr:hypothetical protein [Spirochaetales bacterium]